MKTTVEKQSVPLSADDDEILRIGDTRVTLETVVAAFESGATCEEIAQQYPSLRLPDIYLVIGYYLSHRDELSDYLNRRRNHREQVRREVSFPSGESNAEIRDRLLKRRAAGG